VPPNPLPTQNSVPAPEQTPDPAPTPKVPAAQ
jgi:hypothetical protein